MEFLTNLISLYKLLAALTFHPNPFSPLNLSKFQNEDHARSCQCIPKTPRDGRLLQQESRWTHFLGAQCGKVPEHHFCQTWRPVLGIQSGGISLQPVSFGCHLQSSKEQGRRYSCWISLDWVTFTADASLRWLISAVVLQCWLVQESNGAWLVCLQIFRLLIWAACLKVMWFAWNVKCKELERHWPISLLECTIKTIACAIQALIQSIISMPDYNRRVSC